MLVVETCQNVLLNTFFIVINLSNQGFFFIDVLFAFCNSTTLVFQKYVPF
jgi:hypothetical protein